MEEIKIKHARIKELMSSINSLTLEISVNEVVFFKEITLPVRFKGPELCFSEIINWLYAMFFEVSSPNLNFFTKKLKLYSISITSEAFSIGTSIQIIRTVLNHNLDFSEPSNLDKKNYYDDWFHSIIAKPFPDDDDEWSICINYLLDAVIKLLEAIHKCIEAVRDDENFEDVILPDWINLVKRNYGVYEFERVLIGVLHTYGLEDIFDTNKIAKAQITIWRNELDVLKDGFNFAEEAGRIIEKYLQKRELCPVNGNDLIEMGAKRSPKIAGFMDEVRSMFYENPCNKESLIQRIKESPLFERLKS